MSTVLAAATDWTSAGFMVGHAKVLWTDLVGNICALGTVVLATRRLVVAWPVQLLGAVLLLVASLHAHLGGNAMKQALFIALAAYGWVRWMRGRRQEGEVVVRPASRNERIALAGVLVAGTAVVAWILNHFDASWSPIADAYIFAASAVATYAQAKALLEFWWVYIALDLVGVPLAFLSGLWVTGAVYAVFFVLCVKGFFDWRRLYRARRDAAPRSEAVAA
ncbi:MAG TPA: nicotinamide mononucleotide transporter family protein [Streptosporangiaceae bacterium]